VKGTSKEGERLNEGGILGKSQIKEGEKGTWMDVE
jgi:hypothetical protein